MIRLRITDSPHQGFACFGWKLKGYEVFVSKPPALAANWSFWMMPVMHETTLGSVILLRP